MKPNRALLAVTALVLVLAAAGTGVALAQQQQQQGIVRFVHAVPGGPALDVFVDGSRVFSNVTYKGVTNYAVFVAGGHRVVVVPAGASPQSPLIDTTVNVGGNSYNTFVATGPPTSVRPLVLVNDSTLPPLSQSKVRVVHASPNTPPVDVAIRGGPVLFSNVGFTQATPYLIVPSMTLNLEIRQAGTSTVLLNVPNVTLNSAGVHTIFVVGLLNGQPGLDTIVALDAPPPQAFQVVQATGTPTATGSPTVTSSPAATGSPTATGSPVATGSPTGSPTATGSPAATGSPMATPSP